MNTLIMPPAARPASLSVLDHPENDGHEAVAFHHDPATGLRAIIAVHNTARGPGVGGCRVWDYATEAEALTDVLRLAKGMSYKNALAEIPFGGGKAVILGRKADKTRGKLLAFGRFVERLGGRYVTAEDVGIGAADIAVVSEATGHVAGLPTTSGDPSPYTAIGVFVGMRAALKARLRRDDFRGVRVSVQGAGHVGRHLVRHLAEAGAEVWVADVVAANAERCARECGARVAAPGEIMDLPVDIHAPCALGATLDDRSIPALRCSIVAGAANNQLAAERHGAMLAGRGILYAPDYCINAGGIINIAFERDPRGYDAARAERRTRRIEATLDQLFARAAAEGRLPHEVADQMARERMVAAGRWGEWTPE